MSKPKKGKKVNIAGIEVTVIADDECEKCDIVLCMREGSITPHLPPELLMKSKCYRCGHPVIRDGRGPKLPPSLCNVCMVDELNGVQTETE